MYKVVSIHFTNDCNFDCPFCYRNKGKEMMEKELFLGLPRHLKDITGQVALGGGEPTLHPELVEQFTQECRDYDLTCNLTTNGYLVKDWEDEKVEQFSENLTIVSVSLDKEKYYKWGNGKDYLDTCKKLQKHTLVGCNLLTDQSFFQDGNLLNVVDVLFDKGFDQVFSLYPKNMQGPDILNKKHIPLSHQAKYNYLRVQ